MAKEKKLTDASKANKSGIKLEKELKTFLCEKILEAAQIILSIKMEI